ncbi:amidohydrolase family protein [Herbiconiux sp.]|uniref:amidohydrolase family protein n=1 Tax=Herbiconiux sp. TaxID=1871186 RepID=UPI0025C5C377|nr:amidohydrolase family protein [Herbiconiux sp.]
MRTLWTNALVIAMDEEHGATPFRGDVLIDGADIVGVSERSSAMKSSDIPDASTTVIDATNLLLTPGLVNAHTHSWEILLRGTSAPLPLEIWTLLSYPPEGVEPLSERLIYLRTMVAAIESLLGGVTTLLDDTGELPGQTAASIRALFQAYDASGLRVTCAASTVDVPLVDRLAFADDVLPAEVLAADRASMPPAAEVQEAYLAFAEETRMAAREFPRIRFALSPSAPLRVTDDYLRACSASARDHGEVLHTHLLETKLQEVLAQTRYDGRTIVQHLDDLGALGPNLTAAHAVWLTPGDIDLLAASGASVVHNPLSNLRLGSGSLPWRALHDAGVPVALGTDGASSNDSLRMLEVMKAAALLHTLDDPDYRTWPKPSEILVAATTAGARAAGWGDRTGSLSPGLAADFVVFDLTATTAFTPLNDAAAQLVLSADGAAIHQVWIDGRLVVSDGRCTLIDTDALLAEFRVEAAAYLERHLPSWRALQHRFEPPVREAYLRAWSR